VDVFKEFDIEFKGLKEGKHPFSFDISKRFFDDFENSLIHDGNLKAKVLLTKNPTFFTLDFEIEGDIKSTCDRCLDPITFPVNQTGKMIVKFGDAYDEPSEDVIVLPHEEHHINVAQLIYEFIVFSLPMQVMHKTNECNPEMLAKLNQLKVGISDSEKDEDIDPRWNILKNLTDKNK
jgi:uncharacterized protein